jgi:adenylylsulfate kinase-like enzyme
MACQSLGELGWSVFRIDGDVVRSGLSSDLGFD